MKTQEVIHLHELATVSRQRDGLRKERDELAEDNHRLSETCAKLLERAERAEAFLKTIGKWRDE